VASTTPSHPDAGTDVPVFALDSPLPPPSSSPGPARQTLDTLRQQWRETPLRVRLVGILVVLALVALSVTAAVAVALLKRELVAKVDAQVTAVAEGVTGDGPLYGLGNPSDPENQLPSTQYAVVVLDSGIQVRLGRRLDDTSSAPDVSGITPRVVARHDGKPFTVHATDGSDEWRVVALRVTASRTGSAGTLVVGQNLRDVHDTVTQLAVVLIVVGLSVLVAIGLLGALAVRRAFRPLTEVEDVAQAIARGDLSQRVPDGPPSTEVGRLSTSLNAMLAQIEHAFAVREASEERMRRFVSDASHELRTPLATVRGYAELYRQGAVRDPDDVAGAMRRIETEAGRMGDLVEDLLTLARLDEQRPEKRAPVDLTVIAADVTQDARAIQPDRPLRVTGLSGQLGPVVVLGHEGRLRQVVTNLVANALRHTPAGSPVEVAVGRVGGHGLVEVRDHGPGVDPSQVRRIFERFYRSDSSRGRGGGGGSGLGLAIVAAIVAAHGGRVGIAATPGGGATFVVSLPLMHLTDVPPEDEGDAGTPELSEGQLPERPGGRTADDHQFTADSQRPSS
jgi:two-component system OmpR family sensor kinase